MATTPLKPGTRVVHSKGMPYRYLFEAVHSETLDAVAVYECLYENGKGRLWVRPSAMYHERVRGPGGEERARFAPVLDAEGKAVVDLGLSDPQARAAASRLNGRAWKILATLRRGAPVEEKSKLLEAAYGSLALWREVGGHIESARGHWLVSRAHMYLGEFDLAETHVELCEKETAATPDAQEFDRAYALEARARLYALTGRQAESDELRVKARLVGDGIGDAVDRETFRSDLEDGPWAKTRKPEEN